MSELAEEILALKKQKNAFIIAHNYERPEVQDIADFVGDSLGLSQKAAATDADIIVFCGVHFMAETASILAPDKKVLIPDLNAGCSLAATITADQLVKWKAENPGAVVVSYVNTTADVKAETDYCCTSSNAVKVVNAIPPERDILFCPDMFLGAYVKRETGRDNIKIWAGECHVHAGIRPEDMEAKRAEHRDAEFLIHPECGCASAAMFNMSCNPAAYPDTYILSTEGMVRRAQESNRREFLVATETGILHRMRKFNPGKTFIPVNERAVCQFMKMITLEKVLRALREEVFEVKVPRETADRARKAIQRMVEIC
ncbi:MAG TPA: quinolinate synthase NadA [Kiritimatiellia bacterium]|nr:quinolinate synthase NadA [Kiritimatiellia bacterium]HMO99295.1 quinolinate synthase NadA [Kiritimatiellia bacterium]HMP95627.1 quinolinate synthase NadA [Kiritimatiellia bacterium]